MYKQPRDSRGRFRGVQRPPALKNYPREVGYVEQDDLMTVAVAEMIASQVAAQKPKPVPEKPKTQLIVRVDAGLRTNYNGVLGNVSLFAMIPAKRYNSTTGAPEDDPNKPPVERLMAQLVVQNAFNACGIRQIHGFSWLGVPKVLDDMTEEVWKDFLAFIQHCNPVQYVAMPTTSQLQGKFAQEFFKRVNAVSFGGPFKNRLHGPNSFHPHLFSK